MENNERNAADKLNQIVAQGFSPGDSIINRLLASRNMQLVFPQFKFIQQGQGGKRMFVLLAAFLWLGTVLFVTAAVGNNGYHHVTGGKIDLEDLCAPAVRVHRDPGTDQVPVVLLEAEDMGVLCEVPATGVLFLFEHYRIAIDGQVFYLGVLWHGMGGQHSQHFLSPET